MIEALPGGDSLCAADGGLKYVIDGIPLLTPPLTQWASTESFIPTRLVQSLRIVTGGFPAEYGTALGGVIDITTRPGTTTPNGEAQAEYGSFNTFETSLSYSQAIGKVSFFVAGNFESTNRGLDPPTAHGVLHDRLETGGGFALVRYEARGGKARHGEHRRADAQ